MSLFNKYLKPEPTIVVRGLFKKRYFLVLPNLTEFGVYELPQYNAKAVEIQKQQQAEATTEAAPPAPKGK